MKKIRTAVFFTIITSVMCLAGCRSGHGEEKVSVETTSKNQKAEVESTNQQTISGKDEENRFLVERQAFFILPHQNLISRDSHGAYLIHQYSNENGGYKITDTKRTFDTERSSFEVYEEYHAVRFISKNFDGIQIQGYNYDTEELSDVYSYNFQYNEEHQETYVEGASVYNAFYLLRTDNERSTLVEVNMDTKKQEVICEINTKAEGITALGITTVSVGKNGIAFCGSVEESTGVAAKSCYGFITRQGEVAITDTVSDPNSFICKVVPGKLVVSAVNGALNEGKDKGKAMVLDPESSKVTTIDLTNLKGEPDQYAASPDGKYLFVFSAEIDQDYLVTGQRTDIEVYKLDSGELYKSIQIDCNNEVVFLCSEIDVDAGCFQIYKSNISDDKISAYQVVTYQ